MKKWLYGLLLLSVTACNSPEGDGQQRNVTIEKVATQPVGTIVAADSMVIQPQDYSGMELVSGAGSQLFIVRIKTTAHTAKGIYGIDAVWGTNNNTMQFSMPRGAETVIPILRRESAPYSYIVGFYYGSDTTFYDYYRVSAGRTGLNAGYTKAYLFQ